MKWRRDTCLLRPPPSLTSQAPGGCQAAWPILAQGLRRGPRRQFWSNICPRKNKSPLSLTTGRASLVSKRALLNRRRITDPRESVHSEAALPLLPFALARPLDRSPRYPTRILFAATAAGGKRRTVRRVVDALGTFIEYIYRISDCFRSLAVAAIVSNDLPLFLSVGRPRLKSRARHEECETGRDCLVRIRVSTPRGPISLPAAVILPLKNERLRTRVSRGEKKKFHDRLSTDPSSAAGKGIDLYRSLSDAACSEVRENIFRWILESAGNSSSPTISASPVRKYHGGAMARPFRRIARFIFETASVFAESASISVRSLPRVREDENGREDFSGDSHRCGTAPIVINDFRLWSLMRLA